MSGLEEIEKVIPRLSRAERAKLLALLAEDLAGAFPGIEATPDVCGGEDWHPSPPVAGGSPRGSGAGSL